MLEHFLEYRDGRERNRQLLWFAARGKLVEVNRLLAEGANPDGNPGIDETPLMAAVENGHVQVARVLLRYGANPNTRCFFTTALEAAQEQKGPEREELVTLLHESGQIMTPGNPRIRNSLATLFNKLALILLLMPLCAVFLLYAQADDVRHYAREEDSSYLTTLASMLTNFIEEWLNLPVICCDWINLLIYTVESTQEQR